MPDAANHLPESMLNYELRPVRLSSLKWNFQDIYNPNVFDILIFNIIPRAN